MQNMCGSKFVAAILLTGLLYGCSAKEIHTEAAQALALETIEETTNSEHHSIKNTTIERTAEETIPENTVDVADTSGSKASTETISDYDKFMPVSYKKILDDTRAAMKNPNDMTLIGANYIPAEYYQGYLLGYVIQDINNDGIEELILETKSEQYSDDFIYAMFTLQNEEAIQLFNDGGVRNSYYLCADGTVENMGSNGASSSVWAAYKLTGNELVLQECCFSSSGDAADSEIKWYYTTIAPFDDFSTEITEDEESEIENGYTALKLNMTVLE